MPNWILTLPADLQVITILGLAICIVIIIYKILDGNYSIRSKFFSIGKPDIEEKIIAYSREIIILTNEKYKIKYEVIEKQMIFAEDKADEILSIMQITFINRLKELNEKDVMRNYSFASYRLCLYFLKKELLSKIRSYFRNDYLLSLNGLKFYDYAFEKANFIVNEAHEIMTEIYFFHEKITVDEVHQMNYKIKDEIKKTIIQVFIRAREIALEAQTKAEHIEKQIELSLERTKNK